MPTRRTFLSGLVATGLAPQAGWADVGAPAFLSAGMHPDGRYALFGLRANATIAFQLPLPDRGHAAAAHPSRAEAVAFARRPGRFAVVIDCAGGVETARLNAPAGRHFYGHGAFSADGSWLFTTENDYENAQGIIGVWDAQRGYTRAGELASGGVGPHDIKRLSDEDTFVVANGGIETHPETGRAKLNIPTMRPNLTYLTADGGLIDQVGLDPKLHKNSIRHLAVAEDGRVAFAMQWQGDISETVPIIGLHRRSTPARLIQGSDEETRRMQGYGGSIAISSLSNQIAVTSPRGGVCQVFDLSTGALVQRINEPDICGVAARGNGFFVSAGTGRLTRLEPDAADPGKHHSIMWDNHLVPVTP